MLDDVRSCFVIMPFRKKNDPARKDEVDFDQVYDLIIKPGVEGLKKKGLRINCVRSDRIESAGLIHERMIRHIVEADVAVVDVTTQNPNVFYELGIRHALRDRVTVLVRRHGTSNPFNIGGMTTIEYDLDEDKAERARQAIGNFVRNGLQSGAKDSLVYAVLPSLKAATDPKPIPVSDVEEYELGGVPDKRIGIVTGNLRHMNLSAELLRRPIDIWVSSENVNMQMARPHENSVSGLIHYLGAKKDGTGHISEDTIADELKKKMRGRQVVNPAEVVATGAGTLETSHKVKRIFHVASVYGVVGYGYHPIAHLEQCITNALACVDREGQIMRDGKVARSNARPVKSSAPATSILFPLLGTGTGRAEIIQNARLQMQAAINYLRSRAEFTLVKRVYFLAPTETHLAAMRVCLAELGVRTQVRIEGDRRSARAAPETKRPKRALRNGKARGRISSRTGRSVG